MHDLEVLEKTGIPPLLQGIKTVEDWRAKRTAILENWMDCIGGLPAISEPKERIISWSLQEDHYRIKLWYSTAMDDWVPAYILIPKIDRTMELKTEKDVLHLLFSGKTEFQTRFPAVLALHPTSENGKDDISLPSGRENRRYAYELVKRGYVVLAPDTITAGERVLPEDKAFHTKTFYRNHPEWSAVGKMLADHQQGISLLEKLPMVKQDRIGVIGHSLGGYNSYFLAGIDKRVKAVVCSCGFSTFTRDPERHRWGKREWFSHLPKISDYISKGKVPFEFNEVAGLAAPTPLFMSIAENDPIFPHFLPASQALADVCRLYQWLGEGDKFTYMMGDFGHDFPVQVRESAYDFLDHWLY
ncbi:alpha/beta hydrolase family protein [Neobacillus sp. Marseille-QA0830]